MNINVKGLIPPKGDYYKFDSNSDIIDFLKRIKFLSQNAEELKPLFYKGIFAEEYCVCQLIGYESMSTLVISLGGHLHCINTDCFKEIQPLVKDFDKYINNFPCYCED